mgnify:CR=1 FL=1
MKEETMRGELIASGIIPKSTPLDRAIYTIESNVMVLKEEIRQTTNEYEREFIKIYLSEYENVLKQLKNFNKIKDGISTLLKYINILDTGIFDDNYKCIHYYFFKENYGNEYIEPSREDDEKIQEMIKIMKEYEDDENNQKA